MKDMVKGILVALLALILLRSGIELVFGLAGL